MKAALIPPIPLLKTFAQGHFHLMLSHLLGNPKYRAHYKDQHRKGAYLILDNSAHEHGSGGAAEFLSTQAVLMQVQEIVVPDVLFDAEETIKKAVEAHEVWFESNDQSMRNTRLMYVPQGRTKQEWAMCFRELVQIHMYSTRRYDIKRSFTLGVSKDYEEWSGGLRNLLADYVLPRKDMLHMQGFHMDVHLLGWGRDLWKLGEIAREFPWVRSTDSAKPFVYAEHGIKLDPDSSPPPYPKRPSDYFTHRMHNKKYPLVHHNIRVFKQLAMGML